jgi:hypothetical protein
LRESLPKAWARPDIERYVAEHNIQEEERPEAFARWIAERTGGPVPGFSLRAAGNP